MSKLKVKCDRCKRIFRSYCVSFFHYKKLCHVCTLKESAEWQKKMEKLIKNNDVTKQGEKWKKKLTM